MSIEVKLPVLGDGIDSGDVLEVLVNEGDQIEKEQGIIEIETDKATVEVPSSHGGQIAKIHVQTGQTVEVGQTLITVEDVAAPAASEPAPADVPPQPVETMPPASEPAKPEAAAPQAPPPKPPAPPPKAAPPVSPVPPPAPVRRADATQRVLPAGPAVRRFAREVGVDLHQLRGTGPGARITREDVLEAVRRTSQAARGAAAAPPAESPPAEPSDADKRDAWGPVRVERMTKIRRTIAAKMHESWTAVPRVTNYDDADVTELERIRKSSRDDYAAKGIKLTSLPFVIKSVAMALRDHPTVNASLNMDEEQIIYKEYVNIGIAVDTDRGLVVPSLRDADRLSIPEIARQLAIIAEKVRTGSFALEDLRGSTFTISNLGAIGGTYSTPIINVPEVAILLVGRSRRLPVVVDDSVAIRLMMPLSLSYDHRLVDGAMAARFLNDVIGFLEAPGRLLLAP
jgi:pyruvate/2-oxoglutarate dehydrogenase complex dihydrolipoamide acyltransferase (E2) component